MKLLIMEFSSMSRHFNSLRTKCSIFHSYPENGDTKVYNISQPRGLQSTILQPQKLQIPERNFSIYQMTTKAVNL
jgi:hypothetical protein